MLFLLKATIKEISQKNFSDSACRGQEEEEEYADHSSIEEKRRKVISEIYQMMATISPACMAYIIECSLCASFKCVQGWIFNAQ